MRNFTISKLLFLFVCLSVYVAFNANANSTKFCAATKEQREKKHPHMRFAWAQTHVHWNRNNEAYKRIESLHSVGPALPLLLDLFRYIFGVSVLSENRFVFLSDFRLCSWQRMQFFFSLVSVFVCGAFVAAVSEPTSIHFSVLFRLHWNNSVFFNRMTTFRNFLFSLRHTLNSFTKIKMPTHRNVFHLFSLCCWINSIFSVFCLFLCEVYVYIISISISNLVHKNTFTSRIHTAAKQLIGQLSNYKQILFFISLYLQ